MLKKIQLYVQMSLLLIAECTKIIAEEGSSPSYPPECVVIWSFPNKVRAPEKCLISSRMSPEQKSSVNFVNFVGWVEWCVSRLEIRRRGELFKKVSNSILASSLSNGMVNNKFLASNIFLYGDHYSQSLCEWEYWVREKLNNWRCAIFYRWCMVRAQCDKSH